MKYNFNIDMTEESSLSLILRNIKPNSNVLEFGPAAGYMTKYMQEELGCRVYCVEIDEQAAHIAESFCQKMIIADIDKMDWVDELPVNFFDHVIFADVLEHLRKPLEVLKKAKGFLKYGGTLCTSIPNIGHNAVLMGLLKGEFDYQPTGLLDETHIHFFTKKSFLEILKRSGFSPVEWSAVYLSPENTELNQRYEDFPKTLQNVLRHQDDGYVYQYVAVSKRQEDTNEDEIIMDYSLTSSQSYSNYLQIYWSTNVSDFSEENSVRVPLSKTEEFMTYDINLPAVVSGRFRIDPLNEMSMIEIRSIAIVDSNFQKRDVPFSLLQPGSGLIHISNDPDYKVIATSDDPQILLETGNIPTNLPFTLKITMKYCVDFFNIFQSLASHVDTAQQKVISLQRELQQLNYKLSHIEEELNIKENELNSKENELNSKENELNSKNEELRLKASQLSQIINSKSWKVTAPLRALRNKMNK
ncbi:methyltransferase domain-containing protein [Aneurinibacillus sp. Ricciae_BoGa-3]|uniref:methyltransferase domain-containing protein n=1 Tax=Aneurinibacillus sp. Ricciae_BoGa-3 TaxID=3022697 RepID=UPI00233FBA0A|nr:methyltransferase domain-containing protein [Aneurinibacillus sp. Ricciae_BoGa-3]WCK54292.1 methyltransferase domain-containing protein [Aneurinibacillus sp. Ricciae_BoGa-3]